MIKHITEMDTVYADVFQKMTVEERLNYCTSLIDTTQKFMITNDLYLSEPIKLKSQEIIVAAQTEIDVLTQLLNSHK